MLQTLARAIVHRYPAAWRERYADEVTDLIDSAPVRAFDVGELFRNMLVEQVRAVVDTERPSEAAMTVMRYKFAAAAFFFVLTQAGAWLLVWWRPLPESRSDGVLFLALTFWMVLLLVRLGHWWRQRGRLRDDRAPFPVWFAMMCLPLHLLATTGWVWGVLSDVSTYSPAWMQVTQAIYHSLYLGGSIAAWLMMQIWPGQRLVRLLMEFKAADAAVEGAKYYIASCEEWIDKGVMSPLADAQKALEVRIRERDAVRERLNTLNTRARYSQPS